MAILQNSGSNTVDPVTGITIIGGALLVDTDGSYLGTQATGEPVGGLNQLPGTEPVLPSGQDPGLPYGYTEVPNTGPLG